MPASTGPAIVAVSKGPHSQFRYCWWYRSSHGTDLDVSEIASPEVCRFCAARLAIRLLSAEELPVQCASFRGAAPGQRVKVCISNWVATGAT